MKNKNSGKKFLLKKIVQEINKKLEKFDPKQKQQLFKEFLREYNDKISERTKNMLKNIFEIKENKILDKKQQFIDFVKKCYDGLLSNDKDKFNPMYLDRTVIFGAGNDKKPEKPINKYITEVIKRLQDNHALRYELVENKKTEKPRKSNICYKNSIKNNGILLEMEQGMKRNKDKTKVRGTFVNPGENHLWLKYGKGEKIHTPLSVIKEENKEELYSSEASSVKNIQIQKAIKQEKKCWF